jgi:hypothetical protein
MRDVWLVEAVLSPTFRDDSAMRDKVRNQLDYCARGTSMNPTEESRASSTPGWTVSYSGTDMEEAIALFKKFVAHFKHFSLPEGWEGSQVQVFLSSPVNTL